MKSNPNQISWKTLTKIVENVRDTKRSCIVSVKQNHPMIQAFTNRCYWQFSNDHDAAVINKVQKQ